MLSVMTMSTAVEPWVVTLLACVIAGIALLVRFQKRAGVGGGSGSSSTAGSPPPWAPGLRLPLLGHALSYKANPPGFLRAARDAAGPIFRMDLAGLRTTIVASAEAMKQVATEREAVLSARAAVSDFGFGFTLGDENVFRGTDIQEGAQGERLHGEQQCRWLDVLLVVLFLEQQQQQRRRRRRYGQGAGGCAVGVRDGRHAHRLPAEARLLSRQQSQRQ